jgi:hypothetical protein
LIRALEVWFSSEHDRDQDGFPEWDHTSQAGFHDWPAFVRWREWGQGLDLAKAETPDLASYLYRELSSLIEAARLLGAGDLPTLEARRRALRAALEASWNPETASYHHRDRETHETPRGAALGSGQGEFDLALNREFAPPVRVLVRSYGVEGESHRVEVEIHGRGPQGRARVERFGEDHFQWFWNRGTATSDRAFSRIERIKVRGLAEVFATELLAGDYSRQDASLLLPLWAGIPDLARADRIITATLLDPQRHWRAGGIPMCPASDPAYDDGVERAGGVSMVWNAMLGEGLVRYGFRREAAELFGRLMQGPLAALRAEGVFRERYRADAAEGTGERNHVAGVPPLSLFLRVLGVRLLAPQRVALEGTNPFPWPVTVRWRGLEVRREPAGATVVTFPDGQGVRLEGDEARMVEEVHEDSGPGNPR